MSGCTDATKASAQQKAEFVRAMQRATALDKKSDLREVAKRRMYESLIAKAVPKEKISEKEVLQRKLDGEDENWADFGFDPIEFSIKYHGCSAIAAYSDEAAANGDGSTALTTSRYVVFRLCPSDQCNSNSSNGCGSNYGEYLVPLNEYLQTFGAYKDEEFEAFCEYCENCLYYENYYYGNRKLEDSHACPHYDDCIDYADTCPGDDDGDGDDDAVEIDYNDFFECGEFNGDDGTVYYVGPICYDDGETIGIGIFSDDNCVNYVGDEIDISDYTGIDFSSDILGDYTPESCVSCDEADQFYMIVKNDAQDEDSITELCENLYIASAKCNQNLYDADDESYMSYNQAANEELACGFIENVVNKAYDSSGVIVLSGESMFVRSDKSGAVGQAVVLTLLTSSVLALGAWAYTLNSELQETSQAGFLSDPVQMTRVESGASGVMVGREMS